MGSSKKNTSDSAHDMTSEIEALSGKLHGAFSPSEKAAVLLNDHHVSEFLHSHPGIRGVIESSDPQAQVVLLQIIAIGQAETIFGPDNQVKDHQQELVELIEVLKHTDKYYSSLGGIVGYHLAVLKYLKSNEIASKIPAKYCHKPPVIDMREDANLHRKSVKSGLEVIPHFGEIYVLGGAADRLDFKDATTGLPLPAALFPFQGYTLLEGLIRDLQAREYLHYKLYGWQEETPIVMMTSSSNVNHHTIEDYCNKMEWFGRSKEAFKIISQPLVPLISKDGCWCVEKPFHLILRPGGHGALWKVAVEEGVFDWLIRLKRRSVVVRQINNPVAGLDGTLLALLGLGWSQKKAFGFVSCERMPGAAEGVNVLIEYPEGNTSRYSVTNVEYTSLPEELSCDHQEGKNYPANTNILYADIRAIQRLLPSNPLPGNVVNMKTKVKTPKGEVQSGRLESLMQNIADGLLSEAYLQGKELAQEDLPAFVLLNKRRKTISVTKKAHDGSAEALAETPAGSYYDLLLNYYDLFKNFCGIELPEVGSTKQYVENNWGFLAYLNPALGPLFEVIGQKVRGGKIAKGSVVELEIAELDLSNLQLNGCLRIRSDAPLGLTEGIRYLKFSERSGKCSLRNVTVENAGIEKEDCVPWKKQFRTKEALEIILHGDAEFYAHGVTFKGNTRYEVPAGWRLKVVQDGEELKETFQKLASPTWWWHYAYAADGTIVLRKMAQA